MCFLPGWGDLKKWCSVRFLAAGFAGAVSRCSSSSGLCRGGGRRAGEQRAIRTEPSSTSARPPPLGHTHTATAIRASVHHRIGQTDPSHHADDCPHLLRFLGREHLPVAPRRRRHGVRAVRPRWLLLVPPRAAHLRRRTGQRGPPSRGSLVAHEPVFRADHRLLVAHGEGKQQSAHWMQSLRRAREDPPIALPHCGPGGGGVRGWWPRTRAVGRGSFVRASASGRAAKVGRPRPTRRERMRVVGWSVLIDMMTYVLVCCAQAVRAIQQKHPALGAVQK